MMFIFISFLFLNMAIQTETVLLPNITSKNLSNLNENNQTSMIFVFMGLITMITVIGLIGFGECFGCYKLEEMTRLDSENEYIDQ